MSEQTSEQPQDSVAADQTGAAGAEPSANSGAGAVESTTTAATVTDPAAEPAGAAAENSGAPEATSGSPQAPESSAVASVATAPTSPGASTTATGESAVSRSTSAKSQRSTTGASATATQSKTGPQSRTGEDASAASKKTSPSAQSASRGSSRQRKRQKLGDLDLSTAKIGFVGAGKMAESTINGLIHYAKIKPNMIHVSAPSSKGLERFKSLGCRVTKRNYDIFGRYDCDIIFLCFHGYVIKHCYKLGGARPHPLTTNYIPHQRHPIYILSLVSGVSLSQIKACLLNPESHGRYVLEIHRIMMNTAVGHGLGICAIDCEPDSKKLSAPIRQLLSSIAQLENVPASQMDAACAIGGSGLAFSYYFINALADGAFKMGLSRQQAIRFASKTAQCAAQTMLESGKHPAELRDNVSSPSGAAIYGIHVLEKNDVASGVTAAVEAAHKRANDLATQEVQ